MCRHRYCRDLPPRATTWWPCFLALTLLLLCYVWLSACVTILFRLSIYIFVCLVIYQSLCLSDLFSVYYSVSLIVCKVFCLSVCLSACLYTCLRVRLLDDVWLTSRRFVCVCLSFSLSVCLSVSLSLSLSFHILIRFLRGCRFPVLIFVFPPFPMKLRKAESKQPSLVFPRRRFFRFHFSLSYWVMFVVFLLRLLFPSHVTKTLPFLWHKG